MDSHTGVVCVLVALLLSVAGSVGVGAAGQGQATPTAAPIDPDNTVLRVLLAENGTARWRIDYRIRLDDENATESFEHLEGAIDENPSAYRDRFGGRMSRTVAAAENATGREMALRNVKVTTSRQHLPQTYGVVTYRFDWVGFAAVTEGHVRAGDALAGLFLDEDTTLVLAWPEGYHATDVSPPPDDRGERSVVWSGPIDFGPGSPRLIVAPEDSPPGGNWPGVAGDANPLFSLPIPTPVAIIAAITLLGIALAGGALVFRTRRQTGQSGVADAGGGKGETGGAKRDDGGTEDGHAAGTPFELMSSEERVLALVEANGGRLKQGTVAEKLDWTDARTSQVVRQLRDDGKLETFRTGRENVLTLPGESSS